MVANFLPGVVERLPPDDELGVDWLYLCPRCKRMRHFRAEFIKGLGWNHFCNECGRFADPWEYTRDRLAGRIVLESDLDIPEKNPKSKRKGKRK